MYFTLARTHVGIIDDTCLPAYISRIPGRTRVGMCMRACMHACLTTDSKAGACAHVSTCLALLRSILLSDTITFSAAACLLCNTTDASTYRPYRILVSFIHTYIDPARVHEFAAFT